MARYTAAMLAELETEIITLIRGSTLAAHVRAVDALPDLTPDVIKRIAVTAPAVYVVAGDFTLGEANQYTFELLCLARHAGNHNAVRRGDATAIGLYQLMESVAALLDAQDSGSAIWTASKGRFLRQTIWASVGLSAGTVSISAQLLPLPLDESALNDFVTFQGDYDIDPFQPTIEHDKWLQEPPNHTTSAPELTDSITLQEIP